MHSRDLVNRRFQSSGRDTVKSLNLMGEAGFAGGAKVHGSTMEVGLADHVTGVS